MGPMSITDFLATKGIVHLGDLVASESDIQSYRRYAHADQRRSAWITFAAAAASLRP